MSNATQDDVKYLALIVLSIEYENLFFIPHFKIRIDTAKANASDIILNKCGCSKCTAAVNFINDLNYTDYE
jgi:hypothetical protein